MFWPGAALPKPSVMWVQLAMRPPHPEIAHYSKASPQRMLPNVL